MVYLNEGFSTIKDYMFVVGTPKYTFKTPEIEVISNDELMVRNLSLKELIQY